MMTRRWYPASPSGRRARAESAGAHQALGEERDDPQDAPARDRWEAWSNACSEEERRLYEGGDALDEGGDALVARSRSRTPTSQRSPSPTPSRVEWMATLIEAGASDVREGIIRAKSVPPYPPSSQPGFFPRRVTPTPAVPPSPAPPTPAEVAATARASWATARSRSPAPHVASPLSPPLGPAGGPAPVGPRSCLPPTVWQQLQEQLLHAITRKELHKD